MQAKLPALLHAGLAFPYDSWGTSAVLQTALLAVALAADGSSRKACAHVLADPGMATQLRSAAELLSSVQWPHLKPLGASSLLQLPEALDPCALLTVWSQVCTGAAAAGGRPGISLGVVVAGTRSGTQQLFAC